MTGFQVPKLYPIIQTICKIELCILSPYAFALVYQNIPNGFRADGNKYKEKIHHTIWFTELERFRSRDLLLPVTATKRHIPNTDSIRLPADIT